MIWLSGCRFSIRADAEKLGFEAYPLSRHSISDTLQHQPTSRHNSTTSVPLSKPAKNIFYNIRIYQLVLSNYNLEIGASGDKKALPHYYHPSAPQQQISEDFQTPRQHTPPLHSTHKQIGRKASQVSRKVRGLHFRKCKAESGKI